VGLGVAVGTGEGVVVGAGENAGVGVITGVGAVVVVGIAFGLAMMVAVAVGLGDETGDTAGVGVDDAAGERVGDGLGVGEGVGVPPQLSLICPIIRSLLLLCHCWLAAQPFLIVPVHVVVTLPADIAVFARVQSSLLERTTGVTVPTWPFAVVCVRMATA
jgi:hypothetical protein